MMSIFPFHFKRTLLLGAGLLAICGLSTAQTPPFGDPIPDPIPGEVPMSQVVLLMEEYAQVPSSVSSGTPKARINHLKPANDGSGRLFVNDLRGKMHLVSKGSTTLYLDIDRRVAAFKNAPGLGTGFTSFAFHPEFETNGKLYTSHSENPKTAPADFKMPNQADSVALDGVITEWTATDPTANVFSGTSRELLRVELSGTIHGMQEIEFNPNPAPGEPDYGMLYICIGDGGSTIAGYPDNTSRLDSVLGTILRIDPMGTNSANGNYGVPADNPWVSDGDDQTIGEIWAYGFRNPNRITWDPAGKGIMLTCGIGERNVEEVNLVEPGHHYGWNKREGTFVINPNFQRSPGDGTNDDVFPLPADDASYGYTYPVAQYDHDQGVAIIGGYVYRGNLLPHLYGQFLWGEIVDGRFYFIDVDSVEQNVQSQIHELRIKLDGNLVTMRDLISGSRVDLKFGYDENRELFILEKNQGKIYQVLGSEGPALPAVDFSWEEPVNLTTGDTSVSIWGDLVEALNLQDAASTLVDHTVNGVLFQGGKPPTTGTDPAALTYTSSGGTFTISGMDRDGHEDYSPDGGSTGDWATLSGPMQGILTEGQWSNSAPITVTFNNLVDGQIYEVQLFVTDSRDDFAADYATKVTDPTGVVSPSIAFNTAGAKGGVGQTISGLFVADGGAEIRFDIGGPNRQLNAIQLRAISGGYPSDSLLANISSRASLAPGQILTPGLVIDGTDPKTVLIRVMGPVLADFAIDTFCANPTLTVFQNVDGNPTEVAANVNWGDEDNFVQIKAAAEQVGAWPFSDGSMDSALLINVDPGVYTAQASCETEGDVVAEVYVVD